MKQAPLDFMKGMGERFADWRARFGDWLLRAPVLAGPRGRCHDCGNERERAFFDNDPDAPTDARESTFQGSTFKHGRQPAHEDCSGCGAPPGWWQR